MLKNAELKLDRADKHILDLEREFRAFIDGNAHSIIVEVNQGVRIEFDDHPQITPTIFFGDSTNPFFFGKPIMPMLTTASARLRGVVDEARIFLAIRRP